MGAKARNRVQLRQRDVAEKRRVAGGENGGVKAGLAGRDGVAEGVDAAVDAVQAAGGPLRLIWLWTRPAASSWISVTRPRWRAARAAMT